MKRLFIQLSLFVGICVLLQVTFLLVRSKVSGFTPSKLYAHDDFNAAFSEGDFELVALGNSKLMHSFNKEIVADQLQLKTALLGCSTASVSVSRLTLESYLRHCIKKPKVVLMEVSWFTFNRRRTSFAPLVGDLVLKDLFLMKYMFRYGPKFGRILKKAIKSIRHVRGHDPKISYQVYFLPKTPDSKDYMFDICTFEKVFPDHRAGVDPQLLEDFNWIVETCRKNGMSLILYTAPEDRVYSEVQEDKAEISRIFYQLAAADPRIAYLDYSLGGKYYDTCFELWLKDSHHINEHELFSLELVRDIKAEYGGLLNSGF